MTDIFNVSKFGNSITLLDYKKDTVYKNVMFNIYFQQGKYCSKYTLSNNVFTFCYIKLPTSCFHLQHQQQQQQQHLKHVA